jgi:hypothetical protein
VAKGNLTNIAVPNTSFFSSCYAEYRYAECHYAECHYAECRYAECRYAECLVTHSELYHYFQKEKKNVAQ